MDYLKKIDYSSLKTYINCPRKFLFQYILHLRSAKKSIHLVFGACWHYGLEVVYKHLMSDTNITALDATKMSTVAFNRLWKLEGEPSFPDEDIIFPKSPGHAANMYKAYWDRFLKHDLQGRKVLAVEAPFTITLDSYEKGLPSYIGRMDLIFSLTNGGIEVVDHKTAKAIYPITFPSFEMSYQTDGYLTAGRMYYDKIPKMVYRVALCQKSKIAFEPYTINKRLQAIEHFLSDLIYYSKAIRKDLSILQEDFQTCSDRNHILNSFHRCSGESCTLFMRTCSYYDLCRLRNNPLLWAERPPQGFTIEEWDPETHEENIKKKLEVA